MVIDIPGFYFVEKPYQATKALILQIPGGQPVLEMGSPDLERYSFSLEIPADGNVVARIISESHTDYTNIDVIPSEGNVLRNLCSNSRQKGIAYTSDSFYPGKLIDSDQPFIVRNTRAQSFHVYPLQYNPVTRVLRFYHHLSIDLVYTPGTGINPLKYTDFNIIPIEGINIGAPTDETSALKAGTLPAEKGSMLIICPEKFRTAILPLAEWRIQTGIPVEIINSEQFTDCQLLYNYIKEYYHSHPNLAYLLLVGDAKYVPSYMIHEGASDNYYSYLSGNDHYPDILVGRFSAESIKDVEIQVERTLKYELSPGPDASWITKIIGIGSTQSPGDDGESDFLHIRNLLKTTKSVTPKTTYEFLDGSQGESDAAGNPSTTEITDKINEGSGVIFYTGHGSANLLATGMLTNSGVSGLKNYRRYPIVWVVACEAGNFTEKDCNAEAWLRATNGKGQPTGAVVAVMSSSPQTSSPPMETQDKIAQILSNPTESLSTVGAVSIRGMMSMNDKYGEAGYRTTDTWILFGDPSLRIRTSLPKQMIVDHKGTIGSGRTTYSIKCNTAEGFACISNKGIILGTAALENGMATILLDRPASGVSLILTTTALNYLPSVETIQVVNIPGEVEFCNPVNHSKNQPINVTLSWDSGDGGNPDYYLVYLGTDNPPTNLINGLRINSNSFKPQFNFKYNETYYWKVTPVNSTGYSEGKVMAFTSVSMPDEDFEVSMKSNIGWLNEGAQSWWNDNSQFFDGVFSARSGKINNNESTSLSYPCNVQNCDFVSFWSKTSSEQGDKLKFIIDGTVVGEWSGQSDWSFHIFKVQPGTKLIEWRYSKDISGSAYSDAVWIDNIHLPVHVPATVNIPVTSSICEASGFATSSSAQNYFSVKWSTGGDGVFEDSNLENAVYIPGRIETANGKTNLQLRINSFDGCPVMEKSLELIIHPLPVITLPSDTIIWKGSSVELDASLSGNMTYIWNPMGITSPRAVIDSALAVNGLQRANITVTSVFGCASEKDILIHFNNASVADEYVIFPNPNDGNFSLKPLKGSAVIYSMTLINNEGKVVWFSNRNMTIIGSKNFSIPGLAAGEYQLKNDNGNGRSTNPLIIK